MANDLKCSILKVEFADCKKRAIIWVAALGKSNEPKDLVTVAVTAQERVEAAVNSAQFLQNTWENSPQFNKLKTASENLGKIAGFYKTIIGTKEKIEKNYEALNQIYQAMDVLLQNGIIENNPKAAAAAFDKLFMGFGTLAKKFPPPFDSTVGEFLYELGGSGFFGNMATTMFGEDSNLGRAIGLRDGNMYHGYNLNN
jgi:hypothetical protein